MDSGITAIELRSGRLPKVSVIVPTMNEVRDIQAALSAISSNNYPNDHLEVIVVDGGSRDGTLDVVRSFVQQLPVKVIIQEGCTVYSALNIGLANSSGDVILRVDARSVIPANYIRTCVAHLSRGDIECVGGVQEQYGLNPTGQAIALATRHPLGVGGAAFRVGKRSGYVDTVYLGCYPKHVFQEIGRYDDDGRVVSEDSMFNKRIRDNGGKILLDHTLRVRYPAKSSLRALARQYFIYGGAKAHVWLKYGSLTSPRQAIPLLFLLSILFTAVAAPWYPAALLVLFTGLSLYLAIVAAVSVSILSKERRLDLLGKLILAFGAMHFAWPTGFLLRVAMPIIYFKFLFAAKPAE
jgi:succinoglycan biosynthesis protein ExoA